MFVTLKVTPNSTLLFPHRGFNGICFQSFPGICKFSSCPAAYQSFYKGSCSINGDANIVYGLTDNGNYSTSNEEGSKTVRDESSPGQGDSLSSKEILKKLKRYGISGVLSYGLLNTAYYLTTFLLVWFYVAPVPGKIGYMAAARRFFKVMTMVWAGSQVTKLVRAGGALALAPFVDRGLSWFTVKFKFESQGKAFMTIVGFCFALAFLLFLVVTLLWA